MLICGHCALCFKKYPNPIKHEVMKNFWTKMTDLFIFLSFFPSLFTRHSSLGSWKYPGRWSMPPNYSRLFQRIWPSSPNYKSFFWCWSYWMNIENQIKVAYRTSRLSFKSDLQMICNYGWSIGVIRVKLAFRHCFQANLMDLDLTCLCV